jgi:membrane protein implicated in regulation of membrane protease activity
MIASPLVYWIAGVSITYTKMSYSALLFTIVSITRNYFVRRYFNKIEKNDN